MQQERQSLAGAGPVLASSLSQPGAPDVSLLVEAVPWLFQGESPDLSWLTQHVCLPVPAPP
jgi:hypothetical protein